MSKIAVKPIAIPDQQAPRHRIFDRLPHERAGVFQKHRERACRNHEKPETRRFYQILRPMPG
jgi:hypothetical protein